jgi:adenylate cyclase class 2
MPFVADGLEREIKLRFATPAEARAAVLGLGVVPHRPRRLQSDALLDMPEGRLKAAGSMLRVRSEWGRSVLTFKGPVQPSIMKLREEIETPTGDPKAVLTILERLGYLVWFRYEKYREEFVKDDVIVAVDETPVGTFVELEGSESGVATCARSLGYGPADYVLESYRGLFVADCEQRGLAAGDMLFDRA